MKYKILICATLMSLTSLTHAYNEANFNPWTTDVAFGMTRFSDRSQQASDTAVARLSIGRMLVTKPYWQAGIETGIQSGDTQILSLPKEAIDVLGGVPIEAKIKPFLDVLLSFKTEPLGTTPMVAWFKGGAAYRQLQVDRNSVNNLNGFSPEIQVGLGYRVNEQVTFNVGYQRIFGGQPTLYVDPLTETGQLRTLPGQQAILIGFSFQFM